MIRILLTTVILFVLASLVKDKNCILSGVLAGYGLLGAGYWMITLAKKIKERK